MQSPSLLRGAGYLFTGLKLLTVPGLRRFVLIPLVLSTLLFAAGTWVAGHYLLMLSGWINSYLPSWLQWMEWIVLPLLFFSASTLLFSTLGSIANLVGAPFNALLAQQVERHLTGTDQNSPPQSLMATLFPTIRSEIQKIFYYLIRAIPLLLLFVVPVINVAAPFVWMIFSSWMSAFQYADFPMSNHDLYDKEILAHLREKRLLSLGFGGATLLMTLIPILNFLAMPAAVAGATALWVAEWKR
ncbi:MAG: sulfate transporter CysZ [Magnetococcales bacterium]|nr:sulfate transporter CysZ [Magnetococcales bacterium]